MKCTLKSGIFARLCALFYFGKKKPFNKNNSIDLNDVNNSITVDTKKPQVFGIEFASLGYEGNKKCGKCTSPQLDYIFNRGYFSEVI